MAAKGGSPEPLRMFILDVLRHDDIEKVSSILTLLNDWDCVGWRDHRAHDFNEKEIIPVLHALCCSKYVDIYREHESRDELVSVDPEEADLRRDHDLLWFRLTAKG